MQYTRHESRDGSPLVVDSSGWIHGGGAYQPHHSTTGPRKSRHERQINQAYYADGTLRARQDREWIEVISGGPGTVQRPLLSRRDRQRRPFLDAVCLVVCMIALVGGSLGAFAIGTEVTGSRGWGTTLVAIWIAYLARLMLKQG